MTAYLGVATATNVRVGDPSLIGPVLEGIFVWTGLFLRDGGWVRSFRWEGDMEGFRNN